MRGSLQFSYEIEAVENSVLVALYRTMFYNVCVSSLLNIYYLINPESSSSCTAEDLKIGKTELVLNIAAEFAPSGVELGGGQRLNQKSLMVSEIPLRNPSYLFLITTYQLAICLTL